MKSKEFTCAVAALSMRYRWRYRCGHRVSAPPRGYRWVQTGGDYVLVAITTGIIASILPSQ